MRLRSKFVAAFCASVVATMSAAPVASAQGVLSGAGGAEPQSQFGSAVASGSDLDGDGVIDLIVGARFEDAGLPDRGVVRVFSGKTGTVTQSLLGPQAQARFGTSVASIGDVNGDGIADFAVAAPGAGIASMRSGSNGASLWTAPCDVGPSSPGGSIPALVCALGDVNGDGIPDVAIARSASGAVDVRRGQNGVLIKTITDPSPSGRPGTFGAALSPAGDLDFDGIVELAIGSPNASSSGLTQNGTIVIARSDTGAIVRTLFGGASSDHLGAALALVGDVDFDFVEDLAAGSPGSSLFKPNGGLAEIRSGANGLPTWILLPPGPNARFGASVSGAGLLDANNAFDFAVGAPDVRRVFVYSGAFALPLYDVGLSAAPGFGETLAFPGDVNQDGVGDLIVGAPGTGATDKGATYVVSGQCGGTAPYGAGCKGPFAKVPKLAINGCPAPLGVVSIGVTDLAPGAFGFILSAAQAGSTPLTGGCTSLLSLVYPGVFPFVADAQGSVAFAGQIPLGMTGAVRRFQAFALGAGGAVATTNGVTLTIP